MPDPFEMSAPEVAAEPKKFTTSTRTFEYIPLAPTPLPPINHAAFKQLRPPPATAWNSTPSSSELVQDSFSTPYSELKNYDGTTGKSRREAAQAGYLVFLIVLTIVLLIAGISTGISIHLRSRA